MKKRISIKTVLSGTAVLAVLFAWYGSNLATRAAEKRAIARIDELTENSTSTAELENEAGPTCGTWAGGVVYTAARGPRMIRWMDLDAFRRVTQVEIQHEENPDLVLALAAFKDLERVSFYNGRVAPSFRSPVSAELAGALYLFQALHPNVEVQHDYSESTAYHSLRNPRDQSSDDAVANFGKSGANSIGAALQQDVFMEDPFDDAGSQ